MIEFAIGILVGFGIEGIFFYLYYKSTEKELDKLYDEIEREYGGS